MFALDFQKFLRLGIDSPKYSELNVFRRVLSELVQLFSSIT